MRLFITGATGLIGRRLVLDRLERGDQVVALSRDAARARAMCAAGATRNIMVIQGNPATPVAWEGQPLRAEHLGVRVVLLRTGPVLDNRGGSLMKMVKPFEYYVGGPIGSGRQYMPWIHWRDLIGLIDLALGNSELRGPLNGV